MRFLSRFGYVSVGLCALLWLCVGLFWGFSWLLFFLTLGLILIYRNSAWNVVCSDDKAILAPLAGTITKIERVKHAQIGDCVELKIENTIFDEGVIRANSKMSVSSVKFRHGFFGVQSVEFGAFKSEILDANLKNENVNLKHENLKQKNSALNLKSEISHSKSKNSGEISRKNLSLNLRNFKLNENEKAMLNERVFIIAKNGKKKFALRICAGILDRQIKLCEGLGLLKAGDELGFSLNSSVSLLLPRDTRIIANLGDKLKPCDLIGYFA